LNQLQKTPLHILITDPHTDGGGQVRYIDSLARDLVALGHQVTIGCRTNSVLIGVAEATGCQCLPAFHFARGLRLGCWISDVRVLAEFCREGKPDVVHVNGSQDHWVAGIAKLLHRRDMCLLRTRHNTYPVKNSLVNRLLNRRLTTFQICVCEMVRVKLGSQSAFDESALISIHNGVDAEVYRPRESVRKEVRREFGYEEDDLVCGIAARLVKAKGHTYLLQAIQTLVSDYPRVKLLMLGQGVLEDSLMAQCEELGLSACVQFAGFRDDMERCIQAFDIGVLPSIDCDTSSFSLKEQMASEIPVVTSDYGGLTEIVADGVEGYVVAHGTVEPLAEAIRQLLDSASLRREMGQRGRERVLRDFTGSVFAGKTVGAYTQAQELNYERSTSR
jgi:glycosyltransferase involved in cell wall biosynthesis